MEQEKFLLAHIYRFLDGLKGFFTKYDICLDSDSLDYEEYQDERAELKRIADINVKEFETIAKLLYKKMWYEKKVNSTENGGEGYIQYDDVYFYISRGRNELGYDSFIMCLADGAEVPAEHCYKITGKFGFFEKIDLEDESWMQDIEEKYGVKLQRQMGTSISAELKDGIISSTYDERLHNWKELAEIYYQVALLKDEYQKDDMILVNEFNIWSQVLKYMQEDGVYPEINEVMKDYICDKVKEITSARMAATYLG